MSDKRSLSEAMESDLPSEVPITMSDFDYSSEDGSSDNDNESISSTGEPVTKRPKTIPIMGAETGDSSEEDSTQVPYLWVEHGVVKGLEADMSLCSVRAAVRRWADVANSALVRVSNCVLLFNVAPCIEKADILQLVADVCGEGVDVREVSYWRSAVGRALLRVSSCRQAQSVALALDNYQWSDEDLGVDRQLVAALIQTEPRRVDAKQAFDDYNKAQAPVRQLYAKRKGAMRFDHLLAIGKVPAKRRTEETKSAEDSGSTVGSQKPEDESKKTPVLKAKRKVLQKKG